MNSPLQTPEEEIPAPVVPVTLAVFQGGSEDVLIRFLRREVPRMRTLRWVVVTPTETRLLNVNRENLRFPGLTYGDPLLHALLREVNASFDPDSANQPPPNPDLIREFHIGARYPWGHDRIS